MHYWNINSVAALKMPVNNLVWLVLKSFPADCKLSLTDIEPSSCPNPIGNKKRTWIIILLHFLHTPDRYLPVSTAYSSSGPIDNPAINHLDRETCSHLRGISHLIISPLSVCKGISFVLILFHVQFINTISTLTAFVV